MHSRANKERERKVITMEKNVSKARFIVPSVVGIFLFMIPIKVDGSWTIARLDFCNRRKHPARSLPVHPDRFGRTVPDGLRQTEIHHGKCALKGSVLLHAVLGGHPCAWMHLLLAGLLQSGK